MEGRLRISFLGTYSKKVSQKEGEKSSVYKGILCLVTNNKWDKSKEYKGLNMRRQLHKLRRVVCKLEAC